MRRAHCRCETVQNFSYAEAAEKLGCKERFLRDRISGLPHQRMGESVAFCPCELDLIRAMHTVIPASVQALIQRLAQSAAPPVEALIHQHAQSASPSVVPDLRSIRPSKGRKSRVS
ncbi:hypothetical protein [Streptomyces sp. DH8]|uniref:hypothetical protein n=1 Tax=Streptomyces sp. DH8 TaxID=2857008 RepID=UPI001E2FF102|nr:hypothetical protein [Streptomyces sp. DH8]